MTLPGAILGVIIATAFGLAFHVVRGGGLNRLWLYTATAWVAFFAGHFIGNILDLGFARYGTLELGPAILATIFGLILASILASPEGRKRPR